MFTVSAHRLNFIDSPILSSNEHGCIYGLVKDVDSDGDYLMCTPVYVDGTWSEDEDDWCEVDMMSLLGEDEEVQKEVDLIFQTLQKEVS